MASGFGVVVLASLPAQGRDDPCTRCAPAVAAWEWKANGYALGTAGDATEEAARGQATETACAKAEGLLEGTLKCRGACRPDPEGPTQRCAPGATPMCRRGSYEDDRGLWTFVCRKTKKGDGCDAARAEAEPYFAMCDVKVKAEKELACRHPECE